MFSHQCQVAVIFVATQCLDMYHTVEIERGVHNPRHEPIDAWPLILRYSIYLLYQYKSTNTDARRWSWSNFVHACYIYIYIYIYIHLQVVWCANVCFSPDFDRQITNMLPGMSQFSKIDQKDLAVISQFQYKQIRPKGSCFISQFQYKQEASTTRSSSINVFPQLSLYPLIINKTLSFHSVGQD